MTLLRHKMLNDLKGRRLAPKTQTAYVDAVAGLARYFKKSPDLLTPDQIQRYLVYLPEERKPAWSSCNVVLCGLVFFYRMTLNRPDLEGGKKNTRKWEIADIFNLAWSDYQQQYSALPEQWEVMKAIVSCRTEFFSRTDRTIFFRAGF